MLSRELVLLFTKATLLLPDLFIVGRITMSDDGETAECQTVGAQRSVNFGQSVKKIGRSEKFEM